MRGGGHDHERQRGRHIVDRRSRRSGPRSEWLQIFIYRDRAITKAFVERAKEGGEASMNSRRARCGK